VTANAIRSEEERWASPPEWMPLAKPVAIERLRAILER
jgi:hypothetical protein